jgi:iron complex transport system permease protein
LETVKSPATKYRIGLLVLLAIFFGVFLFSFWLGRYPTNPLQVFQYLSVGVDLFINNITAFFTGTEVAPVVLPQGVDAQAVNAFWSVRFPRVICAALIGAALSITGASYQGLFQNPMVSQDILGATQGASFGAALAFLLVGSGWTIVSGWAITVFAFIFGLTAVLVAYLISKASRVNTILAMILAGMIVGSLFVSGTSFIKLIADTESVLPAITYWLMGSLTDVDSGKAVFAFFVLVPASVPIVLLRWRINLLATGEDEARSMGINVQAMRLGIIVCATFLTATCVSISGQIGWVGLVIPHFCRLIFGYDYRRVILASLLMGASFLIIVDDVARFATTSEIPIGILTAVIGAPVFIFLLLRGGVRGVDKNA